MPNYVRGEGSTTPKLMIIGEAPGREENEAGRPFVGPTGVLVNEFLERAGIHRSECWVTNVVKYQPPFNDIEKLHLIGVDLDASINELWENEIRKFKPNCILAFGDTALKATTNNTGILNYRGSILRGNDGVQKVVPTIHPAALFNRGPEAGGLPYVYKKLIQSDVDRAYEESAYSEFRLPDRSLYIARNSLEVFRFFQEYRSCSSAACDIESINCVPVSVAFAFNKHHSLSIPLLTKINNHPLTDMSRRELAECYKLIQEAFSRHKVIGQNFKYDEFKLRLIGFDDINLISDTLIKCSTIFPELPDKRLCTQSSLWTREPYYKDDGKEPKIGKKFNVDQFFIYNARDSAVTFEVDEEQEKDLISLGESFGIPLKDFYYNFQVKKHKFYLDLENRGFAVDFAKQKELKIKYAQMQSLVHTRLVEQIGYEVNVKSYPQMYRLLYEAMKFPKRKKDPTSEDSIVALLANHCKGKDAKLKEKILTDVLEERRIRDQLSRAINFVPDYDRRCKTIYKITGTETGRTSTGILKKPVRPKKIGLAFHTIPKHGRLAKDIRSMLVPDKGKVIVVIDSSQAEARIVAVLSQDWDLLTAFDKVDIHRRTAGLFFGFTNRLILDPVEVPIVDYLAKDGPERFTGKTFRHAGNYDMRKRTAMTNFNTNAQKYEVPMNISEWKAGQFLELFHAASPKIRQVFHRDIKDALDNLGYLINPFGRPRVFNGRRDDELYKEGFAQIPQSSVADLVQGAALLSYDEFDGDVTTFFCSENHDSLAFQAPVNNWEPYARVVKKHMQRPIDFSIYCTLKRDFQLVIPADVEISMNPKTGEVTNYSDLFKFKVSLEEAA